MWWGRYGLTTTVPTIPMPPCGRQKYGYVPGASAANEEHQAGN